jgi:glycosyltransferase involved in cell wall biosynthesis
MNIAIVGNSIETLINFRLSLMKKLASDHVVYAVVPKISASQKEFLLSHKIIPAEVHLERVGVNPFQELRFIYNLFTFFNKAQIHSALFYFIKPVIYGSIASFLAKVPVRISLIEGLGFYFIKDPNGVTLKKTIIKFAIKLLFKLSLPLSTEVVFLNEEDRSEVLEFLPSLKRSTVMGGIGVDLAHFKFSKKNHKEPLRFVMVCRMLREKGVLEYIEAAKRINENGELAEFKLIGGTDANPGGLKEKELKALALEAGVIWLGEVRNVKDHLETSDVFVLPSFYREGVPRSSQEALAMGMPIITTGVQGCKDTVEHEKNGIMIQPKSVDDLFSALSFFIARPELIKSYGEASRKLAEERFDSREKDEILKRKLT